MKVLALNGSPRKDGNTALAMQAVTESLEREGIAVEHIHVGGMSLQGCVACGGCAVRRDGTCALADDGLNLIIQKFQSADGLLLASPVHYSDITARMKCFLDRAFYVNNNSGNFLRHKVGAALVVARRTGSSHALDTLLHYLTYCEMVIPGSFYWTTAHGGITAGEVVRDVEGMQIMSRLGRNMAWLLKSLSYTGDKVPAPEAEIRTLYSYIRD